MRRRTVTTRQMRRIDSTAIERFRVPGIVLMENAGRAVAEAVVSVSGKQALKNKRVAVVCGPGNNGGDGLVAARHLYNRHFSPEIILIKPGDAFKGDALTNFIIVRTMGLPVKDIGSIRSFDRYGIIIDALLGTGTRGLITGAYRQAIEGINTSGAPVIAADIPSGLDADSGEVLGIAVYADVTVTMGCVKQGLMKKKAKVFVGEIIVDGIGLPRQLL